MSDAGQRIWMFRDDLEAIPQHPLPAGYTFHWYEPGDERHWLAIHRVADIYNTFSPETFTKQFHGDTDALRQRQCYLLDAQGEPIGTATAWYDDANIGEADNQSFGRVHWVAIVPEAQGRGLARPLLTVILNRLRELDHRRAYLSTQTARSRAIHLYERFGFVERPR
ncbi:MAG: GNAT family N-acetyltransferase [bacterium]